MREEVLYEGLSPDERGYRRETRLVPETPAEREMLANPGPLTRLIVSLERMGVTPGRVWERGGEAYALYEKKFLGKTEVYVAYTKDGFPQGYMTESAAARKGWIPVVPN